MNTDVSQRVRTSGRVTFAAQLSNRSTHGELLREAVHAVATIMLADEDASHSAAMVVGELVENTLKYADWTHAKRCARMSLSLKADKVVVSVRSPLSSGSPNYGRLIDVLRELKTRRTAREAYFKRIAELGGDADDGAHHPTRLGLVRIAVEANARLSAKYDDARGELRLRASFKL
jgi:hypothetical protein